MFLGGVFNAFMLALRGALSDSIPLAATATGAAGTSEKVSRRDHAHLFGPGQSYDIAQFNTPRIILSSGTLSDAGLFTGLTAMSTTPVGPVYVWVAAGYNIAAGWYLATFASSTSCQLAGSPATTAGAYAGTTSVVTANIAVTVPANAMGLSGSLTSSFRHGNNNSGGAKYINVKLAATIVCASTNTTSTSQDVQSTLRNQGSLTAQQFLNKDFAVGSVGYTALDTGVDNNLTVTMQLAAAADNLVLGYFRACICKSIN